MLRLIRIDIAAAMATAFALVLALAMFSTASAQTAPVLRLALIDAGTPCNAAAPFGQSRTVVAFESYDNPVIRYICAELKTGSGTPIANAPINLHNSYGFLGAGITITATVTTASTGYAMVQFRPIISGSAAPVYASYQSATATLTLNILPAPRPTPFTIRAAIVDSSTPCNAAALLTGDHALTMPSTSERMLCARITDAIGLPVRGTTFADGTGTSTTGGQATFQAILGNVGSAKSVTVLTDIDGYASAPYRANAAVGEEFVLIRGLGSFTSSGVTFRITLTGAAPTPTPAAPPAPTAVPTATPIASATPIATVVPTPVLPVPTATVPAAGTITAGARPPLAGGYSIFVFGGGTNAQLVTTSGCPAATSAFWIADERGDFITYIPGALISIVNAQWDARFPTGLPANQPMIGTCRVG